MYGASFRQLKFSFFKFLLSQLGIDPRKLGSRTTERSYLPVGVKVRGDLAVLLLLAGIRVVPVLSTPAELPTIVLLRPVVKLFVANPPLARGKIKGAPVACATSGNSRSMSF